jgi:hypothetical protein
LADLDRTKMKMFFKIAIYFISQIISNSDFLIEKEFESVRYKTSSA